MAKAAKKSTRHPHFTNVNFESYCPGKDAPFVLSLGMRDNCGYIDRKIELSREAAVTMAFHIITAAAALEGLEDKEGEQLRTIAAIALRGSARTPRRAEADAGRISATAAA
jgi:hypothetical protein